jgi:hypothetical protein
MKKHLGLILAISAISLGALGVAWFGEGNRPTMQDTPGRSLQKINDLLLIASTNVASVNISNLTLTGLQVGVSNITGLSVQVGVTNFPTTLDVRATNNVNLSPTNTITVAGNIGGYTLVTNLVLDADRTAGGIAANDILAPGIELSNAVRTTGGTGILKCITIATGDNVAPALRLLLASQSITWGTTNAVANLTGSEFSRIQGIVDFTAADFKLVGTNYFASKDVSVGIKPAVNSLFIYPVCTAAITNTNTAAWTIKFTILQD